MNALVSLYAIGVFTGFTLAGSGWWRATCASAPGKWRFGVVVNATSAVGDVDRRAGLRASPSSPRAPGSSWSSGPLMYWGLIRRPQAVRERGAGLIRGDRGPRDHHPHEPGRHVRRHLRPGDRARPALLPDAQPLLDPRGPLRHRPDGHQARSKRAGARPDTASFGINLEIAECEDRRVDRAALELVADVVRDPDVFCMVILPRRGYASRLQRLLHDRTRRRDRGGRDARAAHRGHDHPVPRGALALAGREATGAKRRAATRSCAAVCATDAHLAADVAARRNARAAPSPSARCSSASSPRSRDACVR